MVMHYHRMGGEDRCIIKVDIMKAYNSISWDFTLDVLGVIDAPENLVNWIKACITTPKIAIAFNGSLAVYFPGKNGN